MCAQRCCSPPTVRDATERPITCQGSSSTGSVPVLSHSPTGRRMKCSPHPAIRTTLTSAYFPFQHNCPCPSSVPPPTVVKASPPLCKPRIRPLSRQRNHRKSQLAAEVGITYLCVTKCRLERMLAIRENLLRVCLSWLGGIIAHSP